MHKNLDKNEEEKKVEDILKTLPSINNYTSREEWEKIYWQKIIESKELLNSLITIHEQRNMVTRVIILQKLLSGESYRKISKDLWVSLHTISGAKKILEEKKYYSYFYHAKRKIRKQNSKLVSKKQPKFRGRPRKTKYGTVYLP